MILYKKLRISVFSNTLFRVEYQPDSLFQDMPTLFMGKKLPDEIKCNVEATDSFLKIKTAKCEFYYEEKSDDFNNDILEVTFDYGNEKRKWSRNSVHSKDIPTVPRSLDQWSHEIKYYHLPIIINNDGWANVVEPSQVYWNNKKDWVDVKRAPYYSNQYLFFYGDDIKTAFKDFITVFGKPPLIPRQAFGSWYSRWHDYKDYELDELVNKYFECDIPLDVLVVDVDWHTSHWNGYDWRKKSFPHPDKFINNQKAKGLKLVLNDHPGYELYDPLPEDDSHLTKIKKKIKEPPYKGMWACDWSRKSVVKKWAKYCLKDLLKQGIDWWWIDGWGDFPFPGVDGQFWLNFQYYEITKSFYEKKNSQKRSLILSRWGGIGSHRYPVQFSGDTHSNFENLKKQIYFTAYSGGIGAYYWSHDIGGFHEGQIDEEVYIRWVQFGAFSPVFRTHSNHGIREPFNFSDNAINIYKKYIYLRYKLIPYIEQLHFQNHLTGFPLVYPMNFVYLNNENSEKFKEQYFFGKSFLIAPVSKKLHSHFQTVLKEVWLPEGWWFDLSLQKFVCGNNVVTKYVPIDDMPIFIKSGSIIPSSKLSFPLKEDKYEEVSFNIVGLNNENEEVFYFDDGISEHDFNKNKVSKVKISYKYDNGNMVIDYTVDNEYSFDYLPYNVKIVVLPQDGLNNIVCNNENIIVERVEKVFFE